MGFAPKGFPIENESFGHFRIFPGSVQFTARHPRDDGGIHTKIANGSRETPNCGGAENERMMNGEWQIITRQLTRLSLGLIWHRALWFCHG